MSLTTPAACSLLTADMGQLTARLMTMRLAAENTSVNVAKIVEDHPSLLLQQTFSLDQQVAFLPDWASWSSCVGSYCRSRSQSSVLSNDSATSSMMPNANIRACNPRLL